MNNLFNILWWKAAFFRAFKTFCQIVLVLIGTDYVGFLDVDWMHVCSVGLMSAFLSLLTSVAGLPEVE